MWCIIKSIAICNLILLFFYHAISSEINFKLKLGCNPPTFIDQGVRLEFRLISAAISNKNKWLPLRYYTHNLVDPSNYKSFVELDSSNNSVLAKSLHYESHLPLLLVNSPESVLIQECICGHFAQNFTDNMQLELRWMQRFGSSSIDNYASWILDDIKVRIWNGTCILQLLSEDFSRNMMMIAGSYQLSSAKVRRPLCGSSGNGSALEFSIGVSNRSTRRSINIQLTYTNGSCEEQDGSKKLLLFLRGTVVIKHILQECHIKPNKCTSGKVYSLQFYFLGWHWGMANNYAMSGITCLLGHLICFNWMLINFHEYYAVLANLM